LQSLVTTVTELGSRARGTGRIERSPADRIPVHGGGRVTDGASEWTEPWEHRVWSNQAKIRPTVGSGPVQKAKATAHDREACFGLFRAGLVSVALGVSLSLYAWPPPRIS